MAIDLPGFGLTAGPAQDGLASSNLLLEVVRSLGKSHAFAIVGYAQV